MNREIDNHELLEEENVHGTDYARLENRKHCGWNNRL